MIPATPATFRWDYVLPPAVEEAEPEEEVVQKQTPPAMNNLREPSGLGGSGDYMVRILRGEEGHTSLTSLSDDDHSTVVRSVGYAALSYKMWRK